MRLKTFFILQLISFFLFFFFGVKKIDIWKIIQIVTKLLALTKIQDRENKKLQLLKKKIEIQETNEIEKKKCFWNFSAC